MGGTPHGDWETPQRLRDLASEVEGLLGKIREAADSMQKQGVDRAYVLHSIGVRSAVSVKFDQFLADLKKKTDDAAKRRRTKRRRKG